MVDRNVRQRPRRITDGWGSLAFCLVAGLLLTAGGSGSDSFSGVSLKVLDASAPPGGTIQLEVTITEPKPIATGSGLFSLDPAVFGSVMGVALYDPNGALSDAAGTAVPNGNALRVRMTSPRSSFGTSTAVPILAITIGVRPDALPGSRATLLLDPASSFWIDPTGVSYAEQVKSGTFKVGGTVSINDVFPGTGLLPAGSGRVPGARAAEPGGRVGGREHRASLHRGRADRLDHPDASPEDPDLAPGVRVVRGPISACRRLPGRPVQLARADAGAPRKRRGGDGRTGHTVSLIPLNAAFPGPARWLGAWMAALAAAFPAFAQPSPTTGTPDRLQQRLAEARALQQKGSLREAQKLYEESLADLASRGDQDQLGAALNALSQAATAQGDYGRAAAAGRDAIEAYRRSGNKTGERRAVNNVGLAELYRGDYPLAEARFEEGLALARAGADAEAGS